MSHVYRNIKLNLSPNWIDSAYKALTVCYHPERYGENVPDEKRIEVITSVLKKGHLSIARYITMDIFLELIPHDTAMQLRTHKFLDCQITSQRYTGKHLMEGDLNQIAEDYFYYREPGIYQGRSGNVEITQSHYDFAKDQQTTSIHNYRLLMNACNSEEVSRCVLAQGIRQSMVIRTNLQALMDVIKVRTLTDSQFEIRQVMDGIIEQLPDTLNPIMKPFLAKYYGKNRDTF